MPRQASYRRPRSSQRRGVAIVVVLGLLAIVLALSYALLRTQGTTSLIARNSSRQLDARLAAEAGLANALRKMHEDGWAGVASTLSASVDTNASYTVTYSTGDATLTASSADYVEYPFRVTINSTGIATDPLQPSLQATYQLQAVVQLVRRAFSTSTPTNWTNYIQPTVYQWSTSDAHVNFPIRIDGAATFLGRLRLCSNYPTTVQTRDIYLLSLNYLYSSTGIDERPFGNDVTLGTTSQISDVKTSLESYLGVNIINSSASTAAPLARPGNVTNYSLYPGGKSYTIPSLTTTYGSTVSNVTLAADPVANPLGVFRSEGQITLSNNVSLSGVLLAGDSSADVRITGTGVSLSGRNLPLLDGSSTNHQLPTLLTGDDLQVIGAASASISGLTMVWDEFELAYGSGEQALNFKGRLLTAKFLGRGRQNWDIGDLLWDTEKSLFVAQWHDPPLATTVYTFTEWMKRKYGFNYHTPLLKLAPNTDGVAYRWHDWTQSVYTKGASDTGLKWNLIRVTHP